MAEWLGRGLQNLLRRFESVWYLRLKLTPIDYNSLFGVFFMFLSINPEIFFEFEIKKKDILKSMSLSTKEKYKNFNSSCLRSNV